MAIDGFSNAYSTTLNGAINNSQTTLVVTSTTGAPATTPFRLRLLAEGANTTEIVTVTSVASTTYTITRASEAYAGVQSASAHASGTVVEHVLTAGGLLTVNSAPTMVQWKTSGTGNTALTLTMDATPINGNVIVLGSFSNGNAGLSTVVQTNVTWTKMLTGSAVTSTKMEIWIGKVAASAASLITITRAGGNAIWGVVEISNITVTPTLGVNAERAGTSQSLVPLLLPTTTAGHLICFAAMDTSQNAQTTIFTSIPIVGIPSAMAAVACGYSQGAPISFNSLSTDASGATMVIEVT